MSSDVVMAGPDVAATPEGTALGAWEIGDGRVRFALWAPFKKAVHLVGTFNEWNRQADPLAVDPNGIWWIEKQLGAGRHEFQFVLDGEVVICDPYARHIQWGGMGDQPHAVLEIGASGYQWNDGAFGIKPLNQLTIYELHVGDFSPEGTYNGVTERLDYIQSLGVSAIELMPIQEFPGDQSWGYNPSFYFAPESSYGTPDDLKRLIDAAHQRGIGVILDIVLNHTTPESPLARIYPYDQSPFFSSDGNPWGFPDLNHWNDAVKRLIADIQHYWLTEYHIDGFRYDYVEGIDYDGVNGMSFITWSARQSKPHAYLIGEHIVQEPGALVRHTEADASWHWQFSRVLSGWLMEGEHDGYRYGDIEALMSVLTFGPHGYTDNAQPINYVESHDEERIFRKVALEAGKGDAAAVRKSQLGLMALFTAQGVPMLYAGQEFGARAEKTIDSSKLPWEYLQGGEGQTILNTLRTMTALRQSVPALWGNNFAPLLVDPERKLVVFQRWNDEGSVIVVALNFSPANQMAEIPFPRAGRWHEWMFNYDDHVGDAPHASEIPDSYGKIWVWMG